jgi:type VI secretion system secreted protein VgrG
MADPKPVHKIKCPLPNDSSGECPLIFRALLAKEELSRPFEYEVTMLSTKDDINPSDLLGKSLTVSVRMGQDSKTRHFNGIVARFTYHGRAEGYSEYRAILRPWIWLLTQNFDCRIFQKLKVPQIFEKVCKDTHGFADFSLSSLQSSYREREYCVQYRESDFNFLSRLLEEEGIFYYFTHEEEKHTLVLADANPAFPDISQEKDIVYRVPGEASTGVEHISVWNVGHQIQTGACVLDDYDFTKPRVDLTGRSAAQTRYTHSDFEMYDYPGLHWNAKDGEGLARIRIEELQSQHKRYSGIADHRGMMPGRAFKLVEYPRESENAEYVVITAETRVESAEIEQLRTGAENFFEVSFKAISKSEPFRPARTTPKPFVRGPQTAVVVGKSGEEIWTDKYARVKLQFHWDREGESNENSSCWVRVSQLWAGKNWGGIQIPRIGQEVIVDFLEGDPDRPLVTGRVYNDAQMPPYKLPEKQTQSGLMSRSSKSGESENFNELRFEDKKGEEQIYFHAEKDFERIVENDDILRVGFDKKSPGSQTIEVFKDRKATIKTGDDGTTIEQGNHSINAEAGESTIEAAQKITLKVGGSTITIEPAKITLSSPEIAITGNAKVNLSAPTSQIGGTATLMLNGGVVKIN